MLASAYQAHRALSSLTTYNVGGSVDKLYTPNNIDELSDIVTELNETETDYFVIGGGSNLLISDNGIRVPVLLMTDCNTDLECHCLDISSGASVKLWDLVQFAIDRGISGLEELIGIPGTLGGALRMNAGAYCNEISRYLTTVQVMDDNGAVCSIPKSELGFSYRTAPGLEGKIIVGAEFRFLRFDVDKAKATAEEIWNLRQSRHPLEFPSAGSVFKKHPQGPAGKFIEEAGLKGLRIGDAEISTKHANFIVNKGNARAIEVLALMRKAENIVREKFGISLELEQKLIGFTADELLNPEKYL